MLYKVIGLLTEQVYITDKSKAECNRFMQRIYPSLEPWDKPMYSWSGIDKCAYKQKDQIYEEPIAIVPVDVRQDYINELTYLVRHRTSIEVAKGGWKRRNFNREE